MVTVKPLTTFVISIFVYIFEELSASVFRDNPKIPEDRRNKFLWSFGKPLHSYTMLTPSNGTDIYSELSRKLKVT
jgi:hypothetical protein